MTHKSWTFTAYENGKPVLTKKNINNEQALAALRAAMNGRIPTALESESQVSEPVAELARAA